MNTLSLPYPASHQHWLILNIEKTYHRYSKLNSTMVATWLREDLHLVIPTGFTDGLYLRPEYESLRWAFLSEVQRPLHPSRYIGFEDQVVDIVVIPKAVAIRFQS